MVGGDAVVMGSGLGHVSAPVSRPEGVRVVTRENGRYVDLMPSTLSSYLLPTLADFSLVRREARSAGFGLLRLRDAVQFEEISGAEHISGLQGLFADVGIGLGAIGAFTQVSLGALSQIGLGLSIGGAVTGMTITPATLAGPEMELATAVIAAGEPAGGAVEVLDEPSVLEPLAPDAPVAEVASRIAVLSELSDERLAELFKVERETFCRWRTGVLANPRVGNRRRLGLLLALLGDLAGRGVNIKEWLLNFATPEGLTPYQLLERGRIDDVAYLASSVGEPAVERDARVAIGEEPEPLEFGDDDVWEFEPLEDER